VSRVILFHNHSFMSSSFSSPQLTLLSPPPYLLGPLHAFLDTRPITFRSFHYCTNDIAHSRFPILCLCTLFLLPPNLQFPSFIFALCFFFNAFFEGHLRFFSLMAFHICLFSPAPYSYTCSLACIKLHCVSKKRLNFETV